jgi:hypothetical protein
MKARFYASLGFYASKDLPLHSRQKAGRRVPFTTAKPISPNSPPCIDHVDREPRFSSWSASTNANCDAGLPLRRIISQSEKKNSPGFADNYPSLAHNHFTVIFCAGSSEAECALRRQLQAGLEAWKQKCTLNSFI